MVYYVDDEVNKGWSVVVHMMPRDLYDIGEVGEDITFESEPYHEQDLSNLFTNETETITLTRNDVDDEFVTIIQVVMPPKAKCLKTFIPPLVPNQQPHIPPMAPTQQPHIPPKTSIPQPHIPSKAPTQEPYIPLMAPTQQTHIPPKAPTQQSDIPLMASTQQPHVG
ncbi:hypothetical protein CR513_38789, partial [Mucuna pruriens]